MVLLAGGPSQTRNFFKNGFYLTSYTHHYMYRVVVFFSWIYDLDLLSLSFSFSVLLTPNLDADSVSLSDFVRRP